MKNTTQEIDSTANAEMLWSMGQAQDPALCRALLPRHYIYPHTHADPVFAAAQFFASVTMQEALPDNLPTRYATITAARLIEASVSTLLVGSELLKAAMLTDIDGIAWDNVAWPWPALLFILPQGVLQTPTDGALGFMSIARNNAYQPTQLPGRRPMATRQTSVMACGASTSGTMPLFGCNVEREHFCKFGTYPITQEYHDTLVCTRRGWRLRKCQHSQADRAFEREMLQAALTLLLILNARPDLRSGNPCISAPAWLGRNYSLHSRGAKISKNHWQRGRFVLNRKSQNNGTPKITWVEPAFIR